MILGLLLSVALGAQSVPTASTEMLDINVPDEFQIGNHQKNAQVELLEIISPPETIDSWSRLVTSIMFFNGASTGLSVFYDKWHAGMQRGCPGLADHVVHGTVDGHPAMRADLSCSRNPQTGKPENLAAFLVQGDANLMIAQITFRHSIASPDAALIARVAGSLKVCDQRIFAACSARKATGFIETC